MIVLDKKLSPQEVQLTLVRMYRPSDTHLGKEGAFRSDWNYVYWSQDERHIPLAKVVDKCVLVCSSALDMPVREFVKTGPNRFYFDKMYVPSSETTEEPFIVPLPDAAKRIGAALSSNSGKGQRGTNNSSKTAQQLALVSRIDFFC